MFANAYCCERPIDNINAKSTICQNLTETWINVAGFCTEITEACLQDLPAKWMKVVALGNSRTFRQAFNIWSVLTLVMGYKALSSGTSLVIEKPMTLYLEHVNSVKLAKAKSPVTVTFENMAPLCAVFANLEIATHLSNGQKTWLVLLFVHFVCQIHNALLPPPYTRFADGNERQETALNNKIYLAAQNTQLEDYETKSYFVSQRENVPQAICSYLCSPELSTIIAFSYAILLVAIPTRWCLYFPQVNLAGPLELVHCLDRSKKSAKRHGCCHDCCRWKKLVKNVHLSRMQDPIVAGLAERRFLTLTSGNS